LGGPNAPVIRLKETLQIVDNAVGKPIADAAVIAVTVGQKVSLKGRALLAGKKNNSVKWKWDIGKDALSNYVTTEKAGRPTDLATEELTKEQIEFYWYLEGNKTVMLTADLGGGKQLTKQATFDVHSPKVESLVWKSDTEVKVDDIYYDKGRKVSGVWIHFGGYPDKKKTGHDNPVPGIEYEAKVLLDPVILGGTVYFVQLINGKLDGETFPTIPMPGMDYTQYVFREGQTERVFKGEDSPGGMLPTDQTTVRWPLSHAFVTFVMFKPIGQDSIFVPLAKLEWSINALASRKNAKSEWHVEGKSRFPPPVVTIIQSKGLPTW
jgi:hypothetical protein